MSIEQSPHSPGMNLRKIDLPEPVITYFQQRSKFIRSLPSYEQVEGRAAALPSNIEEDMRFGIFLVEEYPVENQTDEDRQKAERYALELTSRFTRENASHLSKPSRVYMLTGYTRPIRVSSLLDRKIKTVIYVKKPSVERIFGMALYNLLSGNQSQDYIFNNYSFVEQEVQGEHLNDENKRQFSKKPRFREAMVRLATLDDFLAISDLERKVGPKNALANILVQYCGEVVAFDFDTLLQPYVELTRSPLIDRLREMGIDIPERFERYIASDEARKINGRINENKCAFEGLVSLIDKVPYMRSRLEEKGYKSAAHYFKDALRKLKSKMSL